MSTIRDVAREAGVSIATVSRVLQGSPRVLPETQERINEAIRRLDYTPNRLAQQFRSQETKNILVIVPEIGNTFYADIFTGSKDVALQQGYGVLIVDSDGNPASDRRFYGMLEQKQVDGIIDLSASLPSGELQGYAAKYPVVLCCRYINCDAVPNVAIDNMKATVDITNYVLSLGHRRLCYLAGPAASHVYRARLEGFRQAVGRRGIEVADSHILTSGTSIQGGYDAMSKLINSAGDTFTAVIASGDTMAVGAIRALNDAGYRVPDDVAVVGFDDIELSRIFRPSLTTVRQPRYQIGERATEILLDLIAGKPLRTYRTVLGYELIIRESSGGIL